ncbi:MAG: anthranilate synthase component I family protein [Candidatus Hydrogenedentota bacterium]|nr:MAG: anthranilate synthase component I family protein [Candidatus Hydrogenedentota bacterium]
MSLIRPLSFGRGSIGSLDPLALFQALRESAGFNLLLYSPGKTGWSYLARCGPPLIDRWDLLESFPQPSTSSRSAISSNNIPSPSPPFSSGHFLLLSYDAFRSSALLPPFPPSQRLFPDLVLLEPRDLIAFDHRRNAFWSDEEFLPQLEELISEIRNTPAAFEDFFSIGEWGVTPEDAEYAVWVERCREYIAAGDIFQANIARRFTAPFTGDSFALFLHQARANPSPYSAYIDLPESIAGPRREIVCNSPELLLRRDGLRLATRPIAGTYPHDRDPATLPTDPKERAEHVMLVDLERNDLGRVAEIGSVHVSELLAVETYSHLHHIVSEIVALQRPDVSFREILQAVFPGGTITGCPKIRAMQIIDEIEGIGRGLYTGAIGYFDHTGAAALNIVIRTAVIENGLLLLQTGAGIVSDSVPEREARETRIKAAAFLESSPLPRTTVASTPPVSPTFSPPRTVLPVSC